MVKIIFFYFHNLVYSMSRMKDFRMCTSRFAKDMNWAYRSSDQVFFSRDLIFTLKQSNKVLGSSEFTRGHRDLSVTSPWWLGRWKRPEKSPTPSEVLFPQKEGIQIIWAVQNLAPNSHSSLTHPLQEFVLRRSLFSLPLNFKITFIPFSTDIAHR